MSQLSYVDLDDLVLECRSGNARRYVAEAISSYKAGAFRACIVMTWIAVVFDIVDKLREIALTGDARAVLIVNELDKIIATQDLPGALKFERELLAKATDDFEFFSPIEQSSLVRLQEDRHRCAHPSFLVPGEVYTPTPELARSHLRHAIEFVLKHPPVQGKAALNRVLTEISSEYFPKKKEDAIQLLQ